jgi:hypothetical protein
LKKFAYKLPRVSAMADISTAYGATRFFRSEISAHRVHIRFGGERVKIEQQQPSAK